MDYFIWYTGLDLNTEWLCRACVEERQKSQPVMASTVCEECFEYIRTEIGDGVGVGGKPEVRICPKSMNSQIQTTRIPPEMGTIQDISAIRQENQSIWLLLAEDGAIIRWNVDTGEWHHFPIEPLASEPDHKPWVGHHLTRKLHASPSGRFAAVVNDYGHLGQVVDLQTGQVTLRLNGGTYHNNTVRFSFAFAKINRREVAIHRTDWNRLDVSDPATGKLLTERSPTSYHRGEERPAHYLDYFHGALHVSPNDIRILDDGWVWHPVGIPRTWELRPWLDENVWESESGRSQKYVCAREYYWGHAVAWLDDHRVAIGGLGDDDLYMVEGARIFDLTATEKRIDRLSYDSRQPREVIAFAGPAGLFFSEEGVLFSADESGLSRWDVSDGSRTGYLEEFCPTHHHQGAHELVQMVEGRLVRWKIDCAELP